MLGDFLNFIGILIFILGLLVFIACNLIEAAIKPPEEETKRHNVVVAKALSWFPIVIGALLWILGMLHKSILQSPF